MPETQPTEILKQNTKLLINRWQQESLPKEKYEYADKAIDLITNPSLSSIPIISLICANYETHRIQGQRRPTLHNEMIWTQMGLRKGYVLCHEEIPYRLRELHQASQKPIDHLVILVDLGMADPLFTDLNPRVDELPPDISLEDDIDQTLTRNTSTIHQLVTHGINAQDDSTSMITSKTIRLTQLVNADFIQAWEEWNQLLKNCLKLQNNTWAGHIRRNLKKDAVYYQYAWGIDSEETLQKRVIDQAYGLTAVIGDWLPFLHNQAFNLHLESKQDLVMLDTIPGPKNPAHTEFIAYNADYPNGDERHKTPILRPFHNLVLLSDPAIKVPYLEKNMDTMIEEANELPM